MSFSIYAHGSKKNVIQQIKASKGYGDTTHHDALQAALLKIIESAPDDVVVMVDASGHHDYSGNSTPLASAVLSIKMGRI